jgi:hypothetical protein
MRFLRLFRPPSNGRVLLALRSTASPFVVGPGQRKIRTVSTASRPDGSCRDLAPIEFQFRKVNIVNRERCYQIVQRLQAFRLHGGSPLAAFEPAPVENKIILSLLAKVAMYAETYLKINVLPGRHRFEPSPAGDPHSNARNFLKT